MWDVAAVVPHVSRTGEDVIPAVMKRRRWRRLNEWKGKNNFFCFEVVSIATAHVTLHPEQAIPLVNKSTWRGAEMQT